MIHGMTHATGDLCDMLYCFLCVSWPQGELRKATMAIQSSTWNSLAAINDLVHNIFPPISRIAPRSALPPEPLQGPVTATGAAAASSGGQDSKGAEKDKKDKDKGAGTGAVSGAVTASTQPLPGGAGNDAGAAVGSCEAEGAVTGGAGGEETGVAAGAAGAGAAAPGPLVLSSTTTSTSTTAGGPAPSAPAPRPQDLYMSDALAQLNSMAAAEQYNDLSFWAPAPSFNFAGMTDIDELERLMVVKSAPAPAKSMSSGRRHEMATSLSSIGAPLSPDDFSREGRGSTGRTSSDFLSTYNPFAM